MLQRWFKTRNEAEDYAKRFKKKYGLKPYYARVFRGEKTWRVRWL